MQHPPIIDVSALSDPHGGEAERAAAARKIDAAARTWGFFYAARHGVDDTLVAEVVRQARGFFRQDAAEKLRIPMSAGGTA